MTEDANFTHAADYGEKRSSGSGGLLLLIGIVVFLGLSALAAMAFTGSNSDGWGPGHWRHGGFMSGPLDPAEIEDRADRAVRHLAIEIDATAEQQAKLQAVVKAALKDLLPIRDRLRAGRERAHTLLTGPQINRSEIEKFRAEQMALVDAASKRIAQGIADAAEILTPEQRRQIGDHFPRGGFWHRWRHG